MVNWHKNNTKCHFLSGFRKNHQELTCYLYRVFLIYWIQEWKWWNSCKNYAKCVPTERRWLVFFVDHFELILDHISFSLIQSNHLKKTAILWFKVYLSVHVHSCLLELVFTVWTAFSGWKCSTLDSSLTNAQSAKFVITTWMLKMMQNNLNSASPKAT